MEHFTVQQQNDDASCAEKQVGIMFVATVGPKEGTAKGAKVTPIPMLPSQQQPLSTPTKRSSNLTGGNSRGEKRSKCQRLDAYISLNSAATIQPSADDDTEKSSLAKELGTLRIETLLILVEVLDGCVQIVAALM